MAQGIVYGFFIPAFDSVALMAQGWHMDSTGYMPWTRVERFHLRSCSRDNRGATGFAL